MRARSRDKTAVVKDSGTGARTPAHEFSTEAMVSVIIPARSVKRLFFQTYLPSDFFSFLSVKFDYLCFLVRQKAMDMHNPELQVQLKGKNNRFFV